MAVNNLEFSAKVDAWCRQSEARMRAVFQAASQELVSRAQSRIPVDLGFARASIRASLQQMPQIDPGKKGGTAASYNASEISVIIAGAQIGETIYVGWTANYVGALERGHSQQAPSGFVRITAMEWPRIVKDTIARAKGRTAK